MVINPDESSEVEVSFVALVDKPAIERNFLAFNAVSLNFKADATQRIISGPAMVADSLIYRRDENGEYNVFFSKETIKQIAVKFFKKDYQKNLNLFHDPALSLEGVTVFESFVSDKERGVKPMEGFEDLPDGSWFISAKIDNEEVWNKIQSGEVKGFSVEGIFSYVKKGEQRMDDLSGTLEDIKLLKEKGYMSNIKEMLAEFKQKFLGEPAPAPAPVQEHSEYQLKDGTAVAITELAPGGVVTVGDAPAPAGEHELADGTKLTVGDGGVITAVAPAPGQEPQEDMGKKFEAQFAEINQKFSAYEQRFTEQQESLQKLSDSFNKTNETIVHLVGIIEKMSQEPTADPVSQSQNNFQTQKAVSREEKRKELASLFAKIKNK